MEILPTSPYLLLNGAGFIVALLLFDRRLEERLPHRRDAAYVLFVLSVVVGWFGAHVVAWLVGSQSFGRAGFAFYGGLLAALAVLLATAFGLKVLRGGELQAALNAAVVPLVVAHALGRIGCSLTGCCYGLPISGTTFRHPTQVYECVFLLALAWTLIHQRKRLGSLPLGEVSAYLLGYPTFRFLVEFLRGDPRGEAFGLSTSQWISLALVSVACVLFIHQRQARANNSMQRPALRAAADAER